MYVYFAEYVRLARRDPYFRRLQQRLRNGENLQINEVDGPPLTAPELKPFELVHDGSIEITQYVVQHWLRQPQWSFGHGVCLAIALLEADAWLRDI